MVTGVVIVGSDELTTIPSELSKLIVSVTALPLAFAAMIASRRVQSPGEGLQNPSALSDALLTSKVAARTGCAGSAKSVRRRSVAIATRAVEWVPLVNTFSTADDAAAVTQGPSASGLGDVAAYRGNAAGL